MANLLYRVNLVLVKYQQTTRFEYEIILKFSNEYDIKNLCRIFEVSRSDYYKWLKRKDTLNRYQVNGNY